MWMKIAGMICVMVACTALGAETAKQWRLRRQLLESLKRMLSQLKGEILYNNLPLASAFFQTGQRGSGLASSFFLSVAEKMEHQQGKSFEYIWKEETESFCRCSPLGEEEKEHLKQFGTCLGYLDRDMQERTMDFYIAELEEEIQALRGKETERCRLAFGLGILGGLFILVILL